MTTQKRRHWIAEEKLRILEEARQTSVSVSEACCRHSIATGQFYTWERQARQGALEALRNGRRERRKSDPVAQLKAEVHRLLAVIAELRAENLALKKGHWP